MEATYVSSSAFTVEGDFRSIFLTSRRVKMNCVTDGYRYGKVLSSSYDGSRTTVNLSTSSEAVTANLSAVAWSNMKPGVQGSDSNDWIDGNRHTWIDGSGLYQEASSSTPTDSFQRIRKRSRGTLSIPSSVVSSDQISKDLEQGFLNGSYRDVLSTIRTVDSIVGNNIILKEVQQGNNGSGMIDLLRKYGDGILDFPKQSFARVTKNDAMAFADSTEVKILYDDEESDVQAEFDAVTNNDFTAKRAGIYHVEAQITMAAGTNSGVFQIRVKKNSTVVAQNSSVKDATSGNVSVVVSFDIELAAGDKLIPYVYQTSSATIYNTAVAADNFFCIRKVA